MRRLGFLCALLAAPPAVAAEPFDGVYRPDIEETMLWDCHSVGQDGGAVAVWEGRLIGVENTCELTNPVSVRGMDAVLYDALCSGEGESYGERVMLMARPGGLYVIHDGFVAEWVRCE